MAIVSSGPWLAPTFFSKIGIMGNVGAVVVVVVVVSLVVIVVGIEDVVAVGIEVVVIDVGAFGVGVVGWCVDGVWLPTSPSLVSPEQSVEQRNEQINNRSILVFPSR